ncbi:exo-beta-D-glucosaminidase [Kitasatospora aureofaciens]|uniref:glycoside hydrolase family 2 protein n=1 Tax=Kitasatospora aureofaciens TaxID=1894 RepID=UPI0033CB4E66
MSLTGALTRRGSAVLVAGIMVAAAAVAGPPLHARAAALAVPTVATTAVADETGSTTALKGFAIQSSAKLTDSPEAVSSPGYRPEGWHAAGARSTVYAALVADHTYADPFYSENMKTVPKEQFQVPWWYRSDLTVNDTSARTYLDVTGVVSAADVYVNGKQVATQEQIAGMYTVHELDITAHVRQGLNTVAFRIKPNDPKKDLTSGWIDWNPAPPDNNMGMVYDITVRRAGAVSLGDAHVITSVDMPSLSSAQVTVKATARNDSDRTVTSTVTGTIGELTFGKDVTLAPGETKPVVFTPDDTPQLRLANPRIWWPAGMGDQPLYDLRLEAKTDGAVTDTAHKSFGIRHVKGELNKDGARSYEINGHPLLIRGANESPDLLWRWNPQEAADRITHALNMGINTIRLEGHLEPDEFYDMADKAGMLLLPGWECCNKWQDRDEGHGPYTAHEHEINRGSMAAVAARLRNNPSVISFLIGSDKAPSEESASDYQKALEAADWTLPVVSDINRESVLDYRSGLKMTGPYEWVPPVYWYRKDDGGAEGFNSETSAGPSIPTMDTLRRMMTPGELQSMWTNPEAVPYHRAPGTSFETVGYFNKALSERYGTLTSLDDFVRKAQLSQYEAVRAQFEAFGRNFTDAENPSTGHIYFLLNSPWTSLHWQLFDRYFDQGGAYFGAKKANEDVHIQYSYDDRSVVVVNRRTARTQGLTAHVDLYNTDGTRRFHQDAAGLTVPGDGGRTVALTVPENVPDLSTTYLAKLTLTDSTGKEVSRNVYWLSTKPDVVDEEWGWPMNRTTSYGSLDGLNRLARARVSATATSASTDDTTTVTVTLTNTGTGNTPALLTDVHLVDDKDRPVLPVTWSDNRVSLWPGESTTLTATVRSADLADAVPSLRISGWNTDTVIQAVAAS